MGFGACCRKTPVISRNLDTGEFRYRGRHYEDIEEARAAKEEYENGLEEQAERRAEQRRELERDA